MGDLVILELAIMVFFNVGRASWLEVGGGVFIPLPKIVAVADIFTPETPV